MIRVVALTMSLVLATGTLQAAAADAIEEQAIAAGEPESDNQPSIDACLLRLVSEAADDETVGALRARCNKENLADNSLLLDRLERERAAESLALLTPHKRNYFLPLTYVDDPNAEPFVDESADPSDDGDLEHLEAKFQLSLKFAVADGLLLPRDRLYFGFTAQSFWQAYNRNVSAPFRETNYEPEVFWATPFDWAPFGLDAGLLAFGMSHQSNGRGGDLSRSWNRIYANVAFEKENLVVAVKPWWRIPENEKDDPQDADGDDNPDIDDYMGNFEFTTIYRRGGHEWALMLRNNLTSDNKGAVQLEWTFPLWRGVRGYAQYFNGYGESLIDYNADVERIGIGIQLSDLL